MKEFTKSLSSFTLGMSFFGLKQLQNLMTPTERGEDRSPATKAMDSVTQATVDQFDGTLRSAFHAVDNIQRGAIGLASYFLWPFSSNRQSDESGRLREDQERVEYSSGQVLTPEDERRARDEDARRRSAYEREATVNTRSHSQPVRAEESLGRPAEMPVRVMGRRR